ncbi:hypothetical protein HHK36_022788 [Tetracentron sinense]|uniref:Uncharacterized protein n=1 Tax=Tetracentron sinense TaxID=13715 RepID=A0A835D749_TETSI|nr:hypothetical protein HHK36_022788 [Tetracentron sinense]
MGEEEKECLPRGAMRLQGLPKNLPERLLGCCLLGCVHQPQFNDGSLEDQVSAIVPQAHAPLDKDVLASRSDQVAQGYANPAVDILTISTVDTVPLPETITAPDHAAPDPVLDSPATLQLAEPPRLFLQIFVPLSAIFLSM